MIRHRLIVAAVVLALATPAFAQKKAAPKSAPTKTAKPAAPHVATGADEQDLVDLERHLFDYIRAKNFKDVEPWLADDFQYTDSRGETMSREQFLNRVKTFSDNIDWLSADSMRVRVYGNLAVVTGVKQMRTSTGDVDMVAKPSGPPPSEHSMAFTDVFRKRGSDWEMVQQFEADMPATNAPAVAAPASEPQQPEPKPDPDAPPKVARPQPKPPGTR